MTLWISNEQSEGPAELFSSSSRPHGAGDLTLDAARAVKHPPASMIPEDKEQLRGQMMPGMITYRKATDWTDPEALVPHALPWVLAAGNPYYAWLFGGAELVPRSVEKWMKRASSEVSILRVHFLMCESSLAGGFIALNGLDLRKARMADADALWTGVDSPGRRALMERLANGVDLFPHVGEDEYYLSKMGLNNSYKGRRLGRALVQKYLDEGKAHGYVRYRLDVHADNEPAIRCYLAFGFQVFKTANSADGTLRYHSMRYEQRA